MPRDSSKGQTNQTGARRWATFATVAGLFLLALFLRAFWNVSAAKTGAGFVLSGNDPYYHKRAIDFIQATWTTLISDPMLNYPLGARNPNPPFYEWSVAVVGALLAPLFGGDITTSTWWVMEWSPAFWGALTVIPVFYIGRHLFDNRAGVLGAFFLVTATAHIERSALGFADHDAIALFFIVTAFYFYLRAADAFTGRTPWVAKWSDGRSVTEGLTRLWAERKVALGYSALAGMGLAATGLIWKGYPYAIGIMFIYSVLVMLSDHWKNRDSTGLFLGTALAFAIGALVPLPYYVATSLLGFVKPVFFILLAYMVVGLVLVPTRDLPFILVLPAFAIAGLAGVLAAFFAVPDVARSLLYSLVYFRQTTLYTTIAEAHPASFNTAVFSVGPLVYFLAIAGIVWLAWTAFRSPRPLRGRVFMFVWSLVALFMAHSAVRFMFNATPPLAIMGGWTTALLIAQLRFEDVPKAMRSGRGAGFWSSLRRAVSGWQVTGAIFLALLVVFPSVFLAVDAGMPGSAEAEMQRKWFRSELIEMGEDPEDLEGMSVQELSNTYVQKCLEENDLEDTTENRQSCEDGFGYFVQKRLGAFGQGFLPDYWREGLEWLKGHDSDIENPADRPAFLSWWDYGHWAIYVSEHPSVADNFQNGYEFAGNFITAQNETQATQLLTARYVKLFHRADATPAFKDMIQEAGVPAAKVDETYNQLASFDYAPELNLEESVALLESVEEATCDLPNTDGCKRIRYFAVDVRLLPYDNPQTPNIEQSSIFYAPVTLAGKNPDDFVEVIYTANGANPFQDSPRFGTAQFNGSELDRYFARPDASQDFQVTSQTLQYKEKFFNSMFYRTYLGQPVQGPFPATGDALFQSLTAPAPAQGMKHFRLVYLNDQLRMLSYYKGAVLEGTVTEDGEPVEGATVRVYDDAGQLIHANLDARFKNAVSPDDLNVQHDTAVTDANGTYRVLAPFSLEGDITLKVARGGVEVAQAKLDVSREAAEEGRTVEDPALDIQLEPASVSGVAYYDVDGNGQYNATTDEAQSGLTVTVGGKTATTNDAGEYRVTGVSPGRATVSVDSDTYAVAGNSRNVAVDSGANVTHDVALRYKEVPVEGVAWHDENGNDARDDGEGAPQTATLRFVRDGSVEDNTARNRTATVQQNGTYAVSLSPGTYTIRGTFTDDAGTTWRASGTLEVPVGGSSVTRDVRYTAE